MRPEIRQLMLKVLNDYAAFDEVTLPLYFLDTHFPEAKLEFALRWLVRQGIVGRRFIEWYQNDCQSSNLEMHRRLLKAVETLPRHERRAVYAGRDFV